MAKNKAFQELLKNNENNLLARVSILNEDISKLDFLHRKTMNTLEFEKGKLDEQLTTISPYITDPRLMVNKGGIESAKTGIEQSKIQEEKQYFLQKHGLKIELQNALDRLSQERATMGLTVHERDQRYTQQIRPS